MTKQEINIINFLYLSKEKYDQILKYRNQDFIRSMSLNKNKITQAEHNNYFELLKKNDIFFAFLVTKNNQDYGVVSLKKVDVNTYYIGDYLVDENYQFEGGGIVTNWCCLYILNKIDAKFATYDIQKNNTRNARAGNIGSIISTTQNGNISTTMMKIYKFNSPEILSLKSRQIFDKMYEIKSCLI